MKKLLIAGAILGLYSCGNQAEKEIDYALFSGKIDNASSKTVTIRGNDFTKQIPLDEKTGTFADTLYLPKAGLYQLVSGEYSSLYLKNGYDLKITIDAKQFDESISYSGVGAAENNYLSTKFMDNEVMQGTAQEFYGLDENDFKAKVEEITNNHLSKLSEITDAEESFIANEKENLKYEAFNIYNNYEGMHKRVTNNPAFKVSENFLPKELQNIAYNNSELYKTSEGYKNLARTHTLNGIFNNLGADFQSASPKELAPINDVAIVELKNEIIANYGAMFVSPGNLNMEANYQFLSSATTSDKTKEDLKLAYERGLKLMPGKPSPEFVNYENHKGGETSLTDLRGKYVYIDVWATWCGPCIREIPSLKKVEEQFHGSNIAFVSTSIDRAKDHDTWVEMVKDKQLGGMQLMADNAWQSQFVRDYGIDGIPRFILVDPEGNIVSADAPRPSNPKLVEMLQELNI